MPENLARDLTPDGTLGKVLIVFKDVAKRCDTRLFESSHYLIGEKVEEDGSKSQMRLGEIVLQMFRLPALPLVPADQLPQSLEECHRGLKNVYWHHDTYHEGTLTQNGGDCAVSCAHLFCCVMQANLYMR